MNIIIPILYREMDYKLLNLYLTGSTVQQDTRRPSFTGMWCIMQGNETEGIWGNVSVVVIIYPNCFEKSWKKWMRNYFFKTIPASDTT